MNLVQLRARIEAWWGIRWVRITTIAVSVPLLGLFAGGIYYYISFSRLIDARLHGERDRVFPRVFARPLELRRGQSLTEQQLVDRLNDIGYAERTRPDKPGQFAMGGGTVTSCRAAPT